MAVYAFSDLHGNYDLWNKICKYIQPHDTLFCLGDIIDRGLHGYKICLEMMQHSHMHFIRGNHEMLAIEALPYLIQNKTKMNCIDNWFYNGGDRTWDEINIIHHSQTQAEFENSINQLLIWFNNMVNEITYINTNNQKIILSHTGFTPGQLAETGWDRNHFWDRWPDDYNNIFIIHGHTPVQYLQKALEENRFNSRMRINNRITPSVIKYANGHKFDIDLGTIVSKRIALINLDTFEVIYIE